MYEKNNKNNKNGNNRSKDNYQKKQFNNKNNKKYNNKKNYKHYSNKKTIEEYEKIYIQRRMKEEGEKPICPVCSEPIYIIEEAIRHNGSGEFAHFECILNEIKADSENVVDENEKLVYLGAGTFGIVQERQAGKNSKLFVRKRINYENRKVKRINDDSDPEEEELFNV